MSKRIVRNIFENVNDENIALTSEISTELSYKDLKLFIDKISKQLAGNGLSNKDNRDICPLLLSGIEWDPNNQRPSGGVPVVATPELNMVKCQLISKILK